MRFYTQSHRYYCVIDLHARWMYLCILEPQGEILLHRNLRAGPEAFLKAVERSDRKSRSGICGGFRALHSYALAFSDRHFDFRCSACAGAPAPPGETYA